MGVYSSSNNRDALLSKRNLDSEQDCAISALGSGTNSECMNAMERKSYFVDLLLMMGIPVIRATGEAEMTCCAMLKNNLVNGIISRDTDHLVIGCSNLIIALKNNSVEKLNMTKLLTKLGLTHREFVDFCILCGTDYNMPKFGYTRCLLVPEKAISVIKLYGCIENAMSHITLPVTQFIECRNTYETPKDLISQVCRDYNSDILSPKPSIWMENRQILPQMGMMQVAVDILDRFYGI